jgi:hypothetical protein
VRLAAAGLAALALGGAAPASGPPVVAWCPVFPATSQWNLRVDRLPVARGSAALVRSIGLDAGLHADFGSGLYDGAPIGIPVTVVAPTTPTVRVRFDYADESDRGPYPLPAHPRIERGSDRHAILVERGTCTLYELYDLRRTPTGWTAGSGAIWDLRSNRLRPRAWTSADAAGLPILPGLARHEEVAAGAIRHALRFTAPRTRRAFVFPARHEAGDSNDPSLPPMGLRVRLKAGFDTSGFPPQARVVLEALKRYGMILADNGSPWFVSGEPDPGWSNEDLHALGRVRGSDFEVVDTSRLPR